MSKATLSERELPSPRRGAGSGCDFPDMIDSILRTGWLSRWLRRLAIDDELATECARRSYRHENGFVKLVVYCAPDSEFHLRIHLWPDMAEPEQNIHDHRFSFWSHVLRGTISNKLWDAHDGGKEFTLYRYIPRSLKSNYELVRVGTRRLAATSSFDNHAGETYRFTSSMLHTIKCSGSPVTLLLEDRRDLKPWANVYSATQSKPVISFDSPCLSIDDFRYFLATGLELI